MKNANSEQTLVTLANASELVANVAQGVLGNEVADTFVGNPVTRTMVYNLSQTVFQSQLTTHLGAK